MSTRDVNLYGSFEDWFLANMDADTVLTLREHGASCGVGGLCYLTYPLKTFQRMADARQWLATES